MMPPEVPFLELQRRAQVESAMRLATDPNTHPDVVRDAREFLATTRPLDLPALVAEIAKVPGGIKRVREALREPAPPVGVLDPVTGAVHFAGYSRRADGSIALDE